MRLLHHSRVLLAFLHVNYNLIFSNIPSGSFAYVQYNIIMICALQKWYIRNWLLRNMCDKQLIANT